MQTEIEVKFCNIDIDVIRKKLEDVGAVLEVPMRMMKRAVVETDFLRSKQAYLRVRDEGNGVTMTYKQYSDNPSLTDMQEIEFGVSDFDKAVLLLEQVGLPVKSFQESQRETWHFGDVEVVIDVWPHLEPYIEIEGGTEKAVKQAASDLGFNWEDAVFGKVTEVYQRQYPNGDADTLVQQPRIVFDEPLPVIMSGEPDGPKSA